MNEATAVPTSTQNDLKRNYVKGDKKILRVEDLPPVNTCLAIFVLIVNIILPGFGTMFLGCCLPLKEERGMFCYGLFIVGLYQLILTPCLIGWIWSILFGIGIVKISCQQK